MKTLKKIVYLTGIILLSLNAKAQLVPETYQPIFNEIVTNFETIRGSNSLKDGKTSLRLLSQEKIVIKLDHKRNVKTLTFVIKLDEEGNKYWVADNTLTIDMVNKYESDLTKVLEKMLEISREESKK
ncbi:MAG: hypothetical protein CVU09_00680 [Bacteroidetes bacterium HGW-Bacteroidetes-4]|jgi:hypothetical protein|nr:MAG: hypothetical protein CVU09_00680 [Bacteroidetes bacterium HGW-Bacteroidetes-4]